MQYEPRSKSGYIYFSLHSKTDGSNLVTKEMYTDSKLSPNESTQTNGKAYFSCTAAKPSLDDRYGKVLILS